MATREQSMEESKESVTDESDDSLSTPEFLPSFGHGLTPAPCANTGFSVQDEQDSLVISKPSESCSSGEESGFTLDSLLKDVKTTESEGREIRALQAELNKYLFDGKNDLSAEEKDADEANNDDFTEEQKYTLKMLKLEESQIPDSHPGEPLLSDHAIGHIFTEALSPAECGVTCSGHSCLEQLFNEYHPEMLMDILSSDIISLSYSSLPCETQVQRWLFLILSCHSNAAVVQKCKDQLLQLLQWQMEDILQDRKKYSWMPSILDIILVICNWGVNYKSLCLDTSEVDLKDLDKQISQFQTSRRQVDGAVTCQRNFEHVLTLLSSWLQARPFCHSGELNQMTLMLCKLSLDPYLYREHLLYELQVCLASILNCYEDREWSSIVVPWLCRKLSAVSSHHHNQVFITALFTPTCPRSFFIRQRLAYLLFYNSVTQLPLSDEQILNFQLLDLCVVIGKLKLLLKSNNYHISSLIHLLDLSVGPAAHHLTRENGLKELNLLLKTVRWIVSEVRDSMQRLDCTKVKNKFLDLCSKWDLAIKSTCIKQKKIFSCFSTKAMEIEQLEDKDPQDDPSVNIAASLNDDELLNEKEESLVCSKQLKMQEG